MLIILRTSFFWDGTRVFFSKCVFAQVRVKINSLLTCTNPSVTYNAIFRALFFTYIKMGPAGPGTRVCTSTLNVSLL